MTSRTFLFFACIFALSLSSCKKNDNANNGGFTLRVGNQTHVMNDVLVSHIPSINYFNSFLKATTTDGKKEMRFSFVSPSDPNPVGTYVMPVAQGLYKNLQNLQIRLRDDSRNADLVYFSGKPDFTVTISSLDTTYKKIEGTFSGNMDGGYPVPGGFGNTAYSDIRTDFVQGSFNTTYRRQ